MRGSLGHSRKKRTENSVDDPRSFGGAIRSLVTLAVRIGLGEELLDVAFYAVFE